MQAAVKDTAKRLVWFVGLWAAGVLTVGAVAMLMRWALHTG